MEICDAQSLPIEFHAIPPLSWPFQVSLDTGPGPFSWVSWQGNKFGSPIAGVTSAAVCLGWGEVGAPF